MNSFQNTGLVMMLKAMGIDPQALQLKAEELELFGKTFAAQLQHQMAEYDARLSRIEQMLILLVGKVDAHQGVIIPAGECMTVVPINNPAQEKNHGRRISGDSGAYRKVGGKSRN